MQDVILRPFSRRAEGDVGRTVTCMVSFGASKHEPVEPLQSLLDVMPLKLALSAKCTIHDVTTRTSLFSLSKFVIFFKNTRNIFCGVKNCH